jgi:Uma2 family endonuclease
VSTHSRQRDTFRKRNLYARFGVPEYWIIWPEERQVDVLRLVGTLYEEAASLAVGDTITSPLLPGFALPVERLFTTGYGH